MSKIKFFANARIRLRAEEDSIVCNVGFNEVDEKFSHDPHFNNCQKDGTIKTFENSKDDEKKAEEAKRKAEEARAKKEALAEEAKRKAEEVAKAAEEEAKRKAEEAQKPKDK